MSTFDVQIYIPPNAAPSSLVFLDTTTLPIGPNATLPSGFFLNRAAMPAGSKWTVEVAPAVIASDSTANMARVSFRGLLKEQASTNNSPKSSVPSVDSTEWNAVAGTFGATATFNTAGVPDASDTGVDYILPAGARSFNWMLSSQPTNSCFSFWVKNRIPDTTAVDAGGHNLFGQLPGQSVTKVLGTAKDGSYNAALWNRADFYSSAAAFLTFDERDNTHGNPPPYDWQTAGLQFRAWGFQNEPGVKAPTSLIITTTGTATRPVDVFGHSNAALWVNPDGSLNIQYETCPIWAASEQIGTMPILTSASDPTTFIRISSALQLVVSVAGNSYTFPIALSWKRHDLLKFSIQIGNGKASASYQVNSGPVVNLGQSTASHPAIAITGNLYLGCDGAAGAFSEEFVRGGALVKGQKPLWALIPPASPVTRQIIVTGDSISQGVFLASPNTQVWPALLQAALGRSYQVSNLAISGETVNTIAGDVATRLVPLYGPYQDTEYHIFAGTNDVDAGTSPAVAFASLQAVVNACLACGGKVAVYTMLPRTDFTGHFEADRQTFNTSIRSTYGGTLVPRVAVADVGNDATIGQAGQNIAPNYIDATHLTALGQTFVLPYAVAANAALIAMP